ncbi:MAG: hypothetical protein Q7U02_10565 [Desulfosalsimonadaceae bacterium]|nr:hypothetical protein [Desulfosalsimonadaceae bacterium]
MNSNTLYNLSMFFERTSDWHFPEITLTHRMLSLLFMINGERSLAEIYEKLNLTYDSLFRDLQQLHDLHLIRMANPAAAPKPVPKTESKKKTGYYRGTAIEETDFEDTHLEEEPQTASKVKKGRYRGATLDV